MIKAEQDYICVNIWDDYTDDEDAPSTPQKTYAYVEDDSVSDDDCKNILMLLQESICELLPENNSVSMAIIWYDSAEKYPKLVGSEYAFCLYKRWELHFTNLTHKLREALIESLNSKTLEYSEKLLTVYSES